MVVILQQFLVYSDNDDLVNYILTYTFMVLFVTLFLLNIAAFGIINLLKSKVDKLKKFAQAKSKQHYIFYKVYQMIDNDKKAKAIQDALDVEEAIEIEDRAIAIAV